MMAVWMKVVTVGGQRILCILLNGEIRQNDLQCLTFCDSSKSLHTSAIH